MSAPLDQSRDAARWLRYGIEDLDAARALMVEGRPLRLVCMLAQQGAEKALKAGYVLDGAEPPRSHNLGQIKAGLAESWAAKHLELATGALTSWAVASRYPGEWEEPSSQEATEAIDVASKIVAVMQEDLIKAGAV